MFGKETQIMAPGAPSIGELVEKCTEETKVMSYDFMPRLMVGKSVDGYRKTGKPVKMVEVTFEDGTKVRCTPDQKFVKVRRVMNQQNFEPEVLIDGWVEVGEIFDLVHKFENGEHVKGEYEKVAFVFTCNQEALWVESVAPVSEPATGYGMEIEGTGCFVLGNGVVVHC